MSAKWAPKRIEIRKTHKSFWYNQFSAVGKHGSGAIMNRMADNILKAGNQIYLEHKVCEIETTENKINKIHFENQEMLEVEDSIVISYASYFCNQQIIGS